MSTDLTLKHTKGVTKAHSLSREEHKEYRKEVIDFTRSLIEKGITNYGAKKVALMDKFGVTDRMAKKYIKYTKEDMLKRREADNAEGLSNVVIQLEYLYRMAIEAKNYKEAREVQAEIIKLKGYQAPKRIEHKVEATTKANYSHLSLEEKMKIRDMLSKPNNTIDITHEEV